MTHSKNNAHLLGALAASAFLLMTSSAALAQEGHGNSMDHMQGAMPEHMEGAPQQHMTEGLYGEPGDAKMENRTITVTATEIAFDLKDIEVKQGETIRFVLINKGEQPHELVLGDAREQAEHRQMMIEMAGMDMSQMGHADHNSISVEPGETKELIWHFTKPGHFEFACNFPGHADLGMRGPLNVK